MFPQPASVPGPFDLSRIGRGLIFARSLPELAQALAAPGSAAVVQAPPGTGKTTLVPPLAANLAAGQGNGGRVLVTQPRRVAVRSAARRLAALDGSAAGGRVGWSVRGEHRAGPETLVEFLTPGLLLRRLLADPGLAGTSAVVLDEVHERGLDTDLLLGLLGEVRQLRPDLTLAAMSATLDAARFATLLGGGEPGEVPVVDSPSALHPLEVRWVPGQGRRLDERGVRREFLAHVAATAAAGHARLGRAEPEADTLVFLPGAREVADVAARLRSATSGSVEVLELHGQVAAALQDRAVGGRAAGDPSRIIVSTALAESSLTVPGVRLVVDSGLSREVRRDAARGMSGLVTVSASRASADQRAGRAARQGPGTVIRCYDEAAYAAAPAHPTPEIAAADLAGAALLLACWGTPEGRGLALPDAPPAAAMADAVAVLRELGAVDGSGLATPLGRRLAEVPADPRLARALLDGAASVGATAAAEVVAMVSSDFRPDGADLPGLLAALRRGSEPGADRWRGDAQRLSDLAGRVRGQRSTAGNAAGRVVALAFPDRVARRVPGDGPEQYLLASGTRAGLPAGSRLAGQPWLAVAEVSRAAGRSAAGTGALIRAAAPIEPADAEAAARTLMTEQVHARFTDGRVTARRVRRLGAIILSDTPVRPTPEEGRTAVAQALREGGLDIIGFSEAADGLRRRMALLHRELGAPWPDVSDTALLANLEDWLLPELEALAQGRTAAGVDLTEPLRRLLPWPQAADFDELVPERLQVPSGSRVRIAYPEPGDPGGRPVVAVKLQECFGWAQTPRLVRGRVPVLFHLLSPAQRPLAVTDDLESFWNGPYGQVRAEMRGRYPRHPWPEDPWSVPATARTKPRA